ncbi:CBS domain-containing protein [Sphingomonas montana]|uniref:CBS domain-containing protein n=1 Tax=Sphingomonas montana TaxID=1843236 RepID=UPI00096D59A5|nr:CBS domain-containing protein [Sphingomonas montana]
MTIARIMRGRQDAVISVGVDTAVRDVVALLADRRIGAVPVLDGDRVVGVLSERDLVYCLAAEGAAVIERTAGSVMTAPAISVTGDMPVLAALSLMTRRRIRHLPVLDDDRMVGFVSIGDLVKHRIDGIESEAAALRDYISAG